MHGECPAYFHFSKSQRSLRASKLVWTGLAKFHRSANNKILMFQAKLFTLEMKRLLAIPLFALALTLASVWHVWNPYTWGIEVLGYGYPMTWLASFASGLGTHWEVNTAGLAADYLFWFDMSAAGIFSFILLRRKGISISKSHASP